ncbi:type II toxin-antitoxin system prevent-host-death family antitoxin [Deltaproteobacteria bacterium TL4]
MNVSELHPQFITNEHGERTAVIIPIKKYEALLETIEDSGMFNAIKVGVTSGNKGKIVRKAGSAKGKIKISDDFDEPLDDFQEYMQ